MRSAIRTLRLVVALAPALCGATLLLGLGACHKAPESKGSDTAQAPAAGEKGPATGRESDSADKEGAKEAKESPEGGVSLTPEEADKMGIVTTKAKSIMQSPEAAGFGVVIAHETIAQAVADLSSAIAVERQSRSADERVRRLAGTAGAMPADTQEAAERQLAVDQAALELAKRKMSSIFGQDPPWKDRDSSPELSALASGKTKLVRATFPFGSLGETLPSTLRVAHISSSQGGGKSWTARPAWSAPADASVPGKSWFALLKNGDLGEGERVLAWAPIGAAESGAEVPASAIVITAGKYWCYVEEKPGVFVRTEVDNSRPTPDGYFVKEGIEPGAEIVTRAAGQLLARETNPSTEAE